MKYNQKNLEVRYKFWYFKNYLYSKSLGIMCLRLYLKKKHLKDQREKIYYSMVNDAKNIWNLSSKLVKLL